VDAQDIQQWKAQLLHRYSGAYASIQFRALRQFFKWRAAEDEPSDLMARLRAPKVTVTAVPVRRPAASTATCGPAPGTRKRTGLSCGSA